MKIALVDDNPDFAKKAIETIQSYCEQNNISCSISCYNNGKNYLINHPQSDVVFLDIEMPQINGFDIAKKIEKKTEKDNLPFIVFVTCKDHLVFDALKYYPFSFIRKDFFDKEIGECINKINNKLIEQNYNYTIKMGRKYVTVRINDILYVVKEKNYMVFHTNSERLYERSTINEKEKDLKNLGFLRPNIGYLVNFQYIREMNNHTIQMSDNLQIIIGRKYAKEFKEQYHRMAVNKK